MYVGALAALRVWGPDLIVPSPSPAYAPVDLPAQVSTAIEVERAGATVRGWLLEPETGRDRVSPRGTLLLLHGIRDSKTSLLSAAEGHARRGLRVLIVDSRGHGESSGPYLTYGVEESQDLVALVDRLEERGLLAEPLIVHGASYGAGTAIQYAARDPRVRLTIAQSPFASLEQVIPAYLEWIGGPLSAFVPKLLVDSVLDECRERAHFDPAEACPLCVVHRIRTPLRLVHSRHDERIPFGHSQAIRDAAPDAELLLIADAGHNTTGAAPGVSDAVHAWIEQALASPALPPSPGSSGDGGQ